MNEKKYIFHQVRIWLPEKTIKWIKDVMTNKPEDESSCFGEDETYSVTARFDDGIEMDIKLCGVQFQEDEDNLPWTEAVLFKNGTEVMCSEPEDEFFGEWMLTYGQDCYIVNIPC